MEESLHLLANQSRLNKINKNTIEKDLFYLLKKKYNKKYIFDENIFKKILNNIEELLIDETIKNISHNLINNIINDILKKEKKEQDEIILF